MTTQQHILACIDGSAVTESVCDYAAWYASRLGLPVALLNVIDVPASTRRDLSGAIGINSRQVLLEELTQLDEQ
ncbi:MAG TPA: universal stress protein, partial [Psychrobacter sp.]